MTSVHKHAVGTVSWLDVMSPDPERARTFYRGLFGWSYQSGPIESEGYTLCLASGRSAAGIGVLPAGDPFPSSWTIYFAVDDAEAAAARIRDHGGQVLMGPLDVLDQGRVAFCLDPTGAAFGLWQAALHAGVGVVDEPGTLTWSEVNTRDCAAAGRFYEKVFDLEARKLDTSGPEYWTLHRGLQRIFGVLQMNTSSPADVSPHWMPYFAVDDTDAAVARVADLGGTTRTAPFDSPRGRIAVITDPGGATVSIVKSTVPG